MTRVKRSVHARKKRRATLELTKGFRGEAHSNYKRAKEALLKADAYAYRDRRNRKRDFRRLWITRINAAARGSCPAARSPASSSTARCSPPSPYATPTRSDVSPRSPARRRLPDPGPAGGDTAIDTDSLPGVAPEKDRALLFSR